MISRTTVTLPECVPMGWLRVAVDAHELKILSEGGPFTLAKRAGVLPQNTWQDVHQEQCVKFPPDTAAQGVAGGELARRAGDPWPRWSG